LIAGLLRDRLDWNERLLNEALAGDLVESLGGGFWVGREKGDRVGVAQAGWGETSGGLQDAKRMDNEEAVKH